jgi:hypothetical protein
MEAEWRSVTGEAHQFGRRIFRFYHVSSENASSTTDPARKTAERADRVVAVIVAAGVDAGGLRGVDSPSWSRIASSHARLMSLTMAQPTGGPAGFLTLLQSAEVLDDWRRPIGK